MLPALAKAAVVPSSAKSDSEPITLTLVLRRDNQAAFERYLHDIYDPHSKNFHKFLTQRLNYLQRPRLSLPKGFSWP